MFGPLKKIIVIGCMALPIASALAQAEDYYYITGKLKTETGRLTDGRILVEKNGTKDRIIKAEGNGKFELKLDLNSNYIISFSQEGYVTKKLSFNTNVPKERIEYGFDPFDFQVIIFKQYDDISTVVFNQPVGQIRYDPAIDDFDFDKDYTKSILREIEEVEKQTKKREEEEEKKAKEKPQKIEEEQKEDPPKEEKKEEIAATPPPPRAPSPKVTPSPQPKKTTTIVATNEGRVIVMQSYTVGELNYPNLPAYGYINFGDGGGNREISKEQFEQYAKKYR